MTPDPQVTTRFAGTKGIKRVLMPNMNVAPAKRPALLQFSTFSKSDIACTSIVGLALLTQAILPNKRNKLNEVQLQILNFILKKVDDMPNDDITAETNTQIQRKI